MKERLLGRSGISVSEVGFGCWGIGGLTPNQTSYGATDDNQSTRALEYALDRGITFFDTANVYGGGHSEKLLGKVFRHKRDRVIIATKAGWLDYESEPDFSSANIVKSVDESLKRLNSSYVDLLQLHNPPNEILKSNSEVFNTLNALKKSGKIRSIGISTKSPQQALPCVEIESIDVVQVNFNLLDWRAWDCGVLNSEQTKGLGVIARTPLAFGFLTGTYNDKVAFDSTDHRSNLAKETVSRWIFAVKKLKKLPIYKPEEELIHKALRFCLSYQAISSVIPGMFTCDEVDQNIKASEFGGISEKELKLLRTLLAEF